MLAFKGALKRRGEKNARRLCNIIVKLISNFHYYWLWIMNKHSLLTYLYDHNSWIELRATYTRQQKRTHIFTNLHCRALTHSHILLSICGQLIIEIKWWPLWSFQLFFWFFFAFENGHIKRKRQKKKLYRYKQRKQTKNPMQIRYLYLAREKKN